MTMKNHYALARTRNSLLES